MSLIDKLLNLETEWENVWISKELASQIVAALKAGQAMRQVFSTEEYYDVAGNKREELDVDMEEAEEAVKAWDAATKGNV